MSVRDDDGRAREGAGDDHDPAPRRRYRSARRAEQAARTRSDILAAAVAMFAESGWAGTTVAALAERAGVAVETVYAGFGSKKGLLRAAIDVAVVGDAEEIPLAQRAVYQRVRVGSRAERIRAAVAMTADIHERSAGVIRAFREAAAGDEEIADWRDELDQRRRVEVGRVLALALGQEVDDVTVDLVWALVSPGVYDDLAAAGIGRADYEARMVAGIERLLAPLL